MPWLMQKPNLEIGDIVVYKIKGRDIPIVHRVLQLHRECVSLSMYRSFKLCV